MNAIDFALKLKQRRENLGLTQEQVAERVGCAKDTLSNIERSRYNAKLEIVFALCAALGIEVEVKW